ncbi:MAG: AMP-binding protein [Deltaproteobacteria bacterium]|nr:AMP-binding protein [Deltaproteobacteria bacterium]
MDRIWMKHWPRDLPEKISFEHGNIPLHEYLRFQARQIPKKPAIIFYGQTLTYQELDEASDRFAGYLLSKGIKKGDRVGIFLLNCPQYAIVHFGIQKTGAIVCPCSPLFKEMELEYELNDARIEVMVALDLFMPIVEKVRDKTSIRQIVVTNLNDYLPKEPSLPLIDPMKVPRTRIPGTENLMDIVSSWDISPAGVDIDMEEDIGLFQYGARGGIGEHRLANGPTKF